MGRMKEYAMDHPDIAACPCEQCDPSQSDYGCRECQSSVVVLDMGVFWQKIELNYNHQKVREKFDQIAEEASDVPY
jgi:hypothetical protein